jgi:glutamate dehydrogenase (NAD(P)+)
MGTFPSDFAPEEAEADLPLWAQDYEGLGMDDLATGHGVKAAAEAALRHAGRELKGAAVVIEGFGKVGAGTARAAAGAGARVVAVSTVHGLLADPEGLDVEGLIELRRQHGDRLVEHGPVTPGPREELFELDCDVLVPGARPDSITPGVAERLRCAVVAPGANAPYAAGAVETLHRRGIVAVPDFVSNSGGVHLYESVPQDDEPAHALATIESLVAEAVSRLLELAAAESIAPMAAAFSDAREYLRATASAPQEALDELFPAGS